MTRREAYSILGISPETSRDEIKKRYRKLMLQVHPDSGASSDESYRYSAQEINIAYELLNAEGTADDLSCQAAGSRSRKGNAAREKKKDVWNAPLNTNAYRQREILCYAEDNDGTVLGNFCVAKGKYLWTTEEDFPLFLLSVYQCGKQILDECDEHYHRGDVPVIRQRIQAELTYLLAQQFIDGTALLQELAKEDVPDEDGNRIFYIPSMLELTAGRVNLKAGDILLPSELRRHKLYLKNQAGREIGYLSFQDDRLYYIIVPLFEQKRVQIKVQAAEKQENRRRNKSGGYHNLHLWIRLLDADRNCMPENLNLQIDELLEMYQKAD
ncbi:MAG: J domain-containing protein [Lachnospiraceae bacterium]|nr:J domain-containing protein [Lachnospiraceae bacterium]